MIKKSTLSGHAEFQMPNKNCNQHEFSECNMVKHINRREPLEMIEDKFAC